MSIVASLPLAHARSANVESPCVGVCRLVGPNWCRICAGCGRTVEEITKWTRLSAEERRRIMDRLLTEPKRS